MKPHIRLKTQTALRVIPLEWPRDVDTCRVLAEFLAMAESGTLEGLAIAATYRNGGAVYGHVAGQHEFALAGALRAVDVLASRSFMNHKEK